ncbi:hypothetical protein Tco_0424832 [Tanacetum coccineum]
MKEVDHLTIHTPPSPHVASFHLKDTYCYYHPCIDDPKKHYGFKPGLLGQSGSLGVDFLNMEMIEDDWELEPKEVSFLGRRLNLPVRPKEVENVRIKETHHLEHIIQQLIFQHVTPSHNNVDVVFDGAFGGVRDEEVVVREGVVVISSSLDMLTNNYLGGIMVSLIFLEGLDDEALVEFMVE